MTDFLPRRDGPELAADPPGWPRCRRRTACAGSVPVNVAGVRPGDYIVPLQDGTGMGGTAADAAGMSLAQHQAAVGRAIAIEADGHACIVVQAV
ncbi:hypothetical protein [Janthinobacterium sp. 1_2014MBL_MicDiv]|uniref:hypothetical protein n=1 Tax=Janthinobacterium sp. 1_2014MBL_MicDiv TaxID=1644131 RepID=UPI0012EC4831|nr:hypothetical protein [Janthinobacterium sp. 1_2014MBL_MicDiv]